MLYFLYVVNLDFLTYTERSRTQFLYNEIDHLGEFILLMAQEHAKANNVTAEGVVRHGQVGAEIIELANEIQADFVVLGQPQGGDDNDVFAYSKISEFGNLIETESNAKVIFAERLEELKKLSARAASY